MKKRQVKKTTGQPRGRGYAKRKVTRGRILAAAEKVFTTTPYEAASLRTVAKEAGLGSSLISYHFGSKQGLFSSFLDQAYHQLISDTRDLPEKVPLMGVSEDFSVVLGPAWKNRSAFRALMLNLGQAHSLAGAFLETPPFQELFLGFQEALSNGMLVRTPGRQREMFLFWIIVVMANFVGAAGFHARILDMEPDSPEYRTWVQETLEFLSLAAVEELADWEQGRTQWRPTRIKEKKQPRNLKEPEGKTRGQATRKKILDTAKKVFSQYPYEGVGLRQIGAAGGFDFTLIHHYFPAKADLFQAVAQDFYKDFTQRSDQWFAAIPGREPAAGFKAYLERSVSYALQPVGAPAILMRNMGRFTWLDDLPGLEFLARIYSYMEENSPKELRVVFPGKSLKMWMYTLLTMAYSLTGAPLLPARLIETEPYGDVFYQWVVELIFTMFYPAMKKGILAL